MTASEYMKIRLSALDGAGFSKHSVIYPGDGFTSYHLENAIKTLVRSKEVVRVGMIGMNTGVYKLVAKPAKKVTYTSDSPWFSIWPEFFVDPKFSGKKRVIKQVEA